MWRQHVFHRRPMGAGGFVIVVGGGTEASDEVSGFGKASTGVSR